MKSTVKHQWYSTFRNNKCFKNVARSLKYPTQFLLFGFTTLYIFLYIRSALLILQWHHLGPEIFFIPSQVHKINGWVSWVELALSVLAQERTCPQLVGRLVGPRRELYTSSDPAPAPPRWSGTKSQRPAGSTTRLGKKFRALIHRPTSIPSSLDLLHLWPHQSQSQAWLSSQETWATPWKGTKLLDEIQNGSTKMPCSVPWRKHSYHERYTVKCLPSINSPHFTPPQAQQGGTNTIPIFGKRTLRCNMKLAKLCLRGRAE